MPIWLITFLTGLIEPIVMKIISGLQYDIRMNQLEKKQEQTNAGVIQIAQSKTDEDYAKALDILTRGINS